MRPCRVVSDFLWLRVSPLGLDESYGFETADGAVCVELTAPCPAFLRDRKHPYVSRSQSSSASRYALLLS